MTSKGLIFLSISAIVFFSVLLLNKLLIEKKIDKNWTQYKALPSPMGYIWVGLNVISWFIYGLCLEVIIFAITIYL